jgi:Na+-driven multidrug efflux pump
MDKLRISSIKGTAYERDWTQGSIIHNLWSLSWPMIITTSLMMIGPTIDMIWVGKLGSSYIAGVGVAGMVVQMVNAMLMGLFTSLRAMISRSIGAGDEQSAINAIRQAFVIAITFSIVMAMIGFFWQNRYLL